MKTGIVRPIFKKGSKLDYCNYRPITILPTLDKVIEKFIAKQIHSFFETNSILSNKQFGFQPKKSTTQLLSAFTDVINHHLNKRRQVLVVFIDYSKAFDTLQHNKLVERLDECGIRGPILKWCQDYLKDRSFQVKISDAYSDKGTVLEGTAQGSVLGPLHYLTYVNNVHRVINHSEIFQFADDTCLLAADKDICHAFLRLQKDFDSLIKWSHDSGLVLNAQKTKLLLISSSHNRQCADLSLVAHDHSCLHLGDLTSHTCACPPIQLASTQKYLGLVIDNRLKWTDHIDTVCDRLRAVLAKFSIIKFKIPCDILIMLYKALGESIIGYGLSSYGLTCKTHLNKIYNLQIRILKTIVPPAIKEKFKDNPNELFYYCNVLPVHEKLKYQLLVEQFFNNSIQITRSTVTNTRNACNNLLVVPNYTNLYGKNQLKHILPKLINNLPKDIKDLLNSNNIKYKLKQHFLNKLIEELPNN